MLPNKLKSLDSQKFISLLNFVLWVHAGLEHDESFTIGTRVRFLKLFIRESLKTKDPYDVYSSIDSTIKSFNDLLLDKLESEIAEDFYYTESDILVFYAYVWPEEYRSTLYQNLKGLLEGVFSSVASESSKKPSIENVS